MKTLNILVNETVYTQFQINTEANHSSISRELYERIYFHYMFHENRIKKPIPQFPDIVTGRFHLTINNRALIAAFIIEAEYGNPSIIGKDLVKYINDDDFACQPNPEINENLTDAMARISYHYKTHHRKPTFEENIFFFDFDTILTFAEKLLNNGQYEDTLSLLSILEQFVERKLYADINNPRRVGAFLSARFYHTYGLALHHLHRYDSAEKYLISAEAIYSLASPIGYEIYKIVTRYPY